MASLVLGLLIATAKTTYDRTEHDIRTYAAELILLNETPRDYGNDAARAMRQEVSEAVSKPTSRA